MPDRVQPTLPYAPASNPGLSLVNSRLRFRIVGLTLLVLALSIGLGVFGNVYASNRFPGITRGMTRAQVDRHLWAFANSPSPYNAMDPTDSAVAYQFLWYGKMTEIKIIFDANGIVISKIPSFNN